MAQSFIQIETRTGPPTGFALFELGFRPFFLFGGLFAVLSILAWMGIYLFSVPLIAEPIGGVFWHAHEMIYGFVVAVIAGFLLTAVSNWTGADGYRGVGLALLLLSWLLPRIALLFSGPLAIAVAALFDSLFMLGLVVIFSRPVFQVKQWKQMGILSKLILLWVTNLLFYAGTLGQLEQGMEWGIYGGLYVTLGLLFAMARRVVPFFIQNAVKESFKARNVLWLDMASMILFLLWAVLDIFYAEYGNAIAALSVALVLIHLLRLQGWHTPGIWKAPLLWSLYVGYLFLVAGFALKAMAIWTNTSQAMALHAFAYGGLGLMILGMMARVVLGHTGRSVLQPSKVIGPMLGLLLLGALARVFLPLLDAGHHTLWMGLSQVLWMIAFAVFVVLHAPMLLRPRIDGKRG